MQRATHKGTCQACGREQMLPGGLLSQHGYSVRWNMFVGVCPGSDRQPFEQDKSFVERQMHWALGQMNAETDIAEELETCDPRDTRAWVRERDLKEMYSAKDRWVVRPLELLPALTRSVSGHWGRVGYVDDRGSVHVVHSYEIKGPRYEDDRPVYDQAHVEEYVREMNRICSKLVHRHRASQMREYANWQASRLKGWAPKPLMERKD